MTENDAGVPDGYLLDGRQLTLAAQGDLEATVRALGVDPARVVVLPDFELDGAGPDLAQLSEGPFAQVLQAAAATAVSLGAAAQRMSDEVRREAEQDAARIQREAYQEARRIRAEARRRAAARELGARLHAAVEDRALQGRRQLDVTAAPRTSTRASRRRGRWADDPLLDPRIAAQLRADARRHRERHHRARVFVAGVAALALATAGLASMVWTGTTPLEAGRSVVAAGAQVLDLGNAEQLRQVLPIDQLAGRLRDSPQEMGSVGVQLVGALDQVQELDAASRGNRALGLLTDIERAVRDGTLTPETERLVRPVLLREATPADPAGLIAELAVRPLGAGPDGPWILARLQAAGPAPTRAQRVVLMREIRDASDRGRLTSAFRVVAASVLEGPGR